MSTSFSDVVLVLTVLGMITSGSAMIHLAGNNAQGMPIGLHSHSKLIIIVQDIFRAMPQ